MRIDATALAAVATVSPAGPRTAAEAATQFEALLVGEMLRTARQAGMAAWAGEDSDAASATMLDMAETELAKALAVQGGLGLARMITQDLGITGR